MFQNFSSLVWSGIIIYLLTTALRCRLEVPAEYEPSWGNGCCRSSFLYLLQSHFTVLAFTCLTLRFTDVANLWDSHHNAKVRLCTVTPICLEFRAGFSLDVLGWNMFLRQKSATSSRFHKWKLAIWRLLFSLVKNELELGKSDIISLLILSAN